MDITFVAGEAHIDIGAMRKLCYLSLNIVTLILKVTNTHIREETLVTKDDYYHKLIQSSIHRAS